MRAQTNAPNQGISDLVAVLRLKEGDQIAHALVSEQESSLLWTYIIRNVEPEPTTFAEALASKHHDVYMISMNSDFEGLLTARIFSIVYPPPISI